MTLDGELLRRYAEAGSEDAFGELVRRHLELVYSAALRQVNGDTHLAQDVAQTVFTDLARKAAVLSERQVLTGWLYTSTHFAAAKAVRTEHRRHAREQEAHAMNELLDSATPDFDWERLSPVLDGLMQELKEPDRDVILMRYFENRPLVDIGKVLGLSEDTARKRVDRALEKLRAMVSKQGIGTAVGLGAALSTNAAQVAPVGLAAVLTSASMAGVAAETGSALTLLKAMTMTKIQAGIAGAIVVAGILTPLVIQHRALNSLRGQNISLRQQVDQAAQLRAENQRMSNLLAAAESSQSLPPDQFSELLRLRGEAGVQKSEREKLRAELVARRNSATSLALRTPASANYYPKGSWWATAGNATPEAALQSTSWTMAQAMSQTNLQALLALVGPEMQAEAAKHFAGKSDSEIAAEVASEAATFAKEEGFRVINKKTISEDEIVLTFYIDGPDAFGMMPFKRSADGWKVSDTPKKP
jgi:RNA polymerase sigma factor (sigma-70 family)